MRFNDERVQRLLKEDPREAKQAVWVQDELRDLRRGLKEALDVITTLRGEKPTEESDAWLETSNGENDRFIGLGHRARIRIPIGDKRRANGMPLHYMDVEAGRDNTYNRETGRYDVGPVSHVVVRVDGGRVMIPMGSAVNVAEVRFWADR